MPFLRLSHGAIVLRVYADDADVLAWLREFLVPAFVAEEGAPEAGDIGLHLDVDAHEHARLTRAFASVGLDEIDGLTFDGTFSRHRRWVDSSGYRWAYDDERDLYYGSAPDSREFRVLLAKSGRRGRIAYMRVVREIATSARLQEGGLPIHAAAFARSDGVVLVCGRKRSGKTTFLAHVLACGASFVANDRVFLEPSPSFDVHGMPSAVALRGGTLGLLPRFGERFEQARFEAARTIAECQPGVERSEPELPRGKERPPVSPAQFCALAGAKMIAGGRVVLCLFPRLDSTVKDLVFERIQPAAGASLLMESLLRPSTPIRGSELFKLGTERTVLTTDQEERRCQELLATVPAWECRLGLAAYEDDLLKVLDSALR